MNRVLSTALLFAVAVFHLSTESRAADPVRVACVGDSITEDSYPAKLQEVLGSGWNVLNFGAGGRTMLRKADPFDHHPALSSSPDIVIIALGTNDSKTPIWSGHKNEFIGDYVAMIKEFQTLPSHPKVYACLPPPAFPGNWGITEDVIRNEVIPAITRHCWKTNLGFLTPCIPMAKEPNASLSLWGRLSRQSKAIARREGST